MMGSGRLFAAESGSEITERGGKSSPKDANTVACPLGNKVVLSAISLSSAPAATRLRSFGSVAIHCPFRMMGPNDDPKPQDQ